MAAHSSNVPRISSLLRKHTAARLSGSQASSIALPLAALDDALPDRVLIGTFLIDVVALKGALHAKHEAGIDLLVQLVAARGSELSASVSAGFGEIHRRLTEKPENIEALTALEEFRAEVPRRTNALAAELEEMSSCYDALEGFQVEIAEQDYTARWGACRWAGVAGERRRRPHRAQRGEIVHGGCRLLHGRVLVVRRLDALILQGLDPGAALLQ